MFYLMGMERMCLMNEILEGKLTGNIIRFAMPIAAASMLQQLFNAADTAVVGYFVDTIALAAVGTNAEITALLVSISSGLAVGLNVTIAWEIGRHKKDSGTPEAIHTGLALSFIIGCAMLCLVLLFSSPVLTLIQTPADAFPQALLYLRLYAAGLPFLLLYDFACAVERARGCSRHPLYALLFSGVLNVCLNLFFVIVCGLGVAGVAVATDISTACSALLTLCWLARDPDPDFRFSLRRLSLRRSVIRNLLRIGVPAAVQSAVFCFANIFVQAAVNAFGSVATAGAAAAMNFEYFTYYMITAFGQTATTFTGQNQAAGQYERSRRILFLCMLYGFLFSAAISTPVTIFCRAASSLYSKDPAVIEAACMRIRIILVLTPLCSFYEIPAGYLRGCGHSLTPALETVVGTCLVRILWIFTGFRWFHSLQMLYIIFPVSWFLTILLLWISVLRQFSRDRRKQGGMTDAPYEPSLLPHGGRKQHRVPQKES